MAWMILFDASFGEKDNIVIGIEEFYVKPKDIWKVKFRIKTTRNDAINSIVYINVDILMEL